MRVRERYPPFHKKRKGSQCPGSKVRTKADNPLAYDLGRCWRLYRDVLSASMLRILRIIFKWKREQRLRLVRTGDQNLYWIDIMLLRFHKPSYACALQTPEHFSVLTVFSDWSFQIKLFSLPKQFEQARWIQMGIGRESAFQYILTLISFFEVFYHRFKLAQLVLARFT